MRHEKFTGLVLAGGRSLRFGSAKAAHTVDGRRMIDRVLAAVQPLVCEVLISVQRVDDVPAGLDAKPVTDRHPGLGPLSGLQAGLMRAETPWLVVVACDMPFITGRALESLIRHCGPHERAVLAKGSDGRTHPLCACYHRSILEVVEARLRSEDRSMDALLARLDAATVPLPDALIRNVNRLSDLR